MLSDSFLTSWISVSAARPETADRNGLNIHRLLRRLLLALLAELLATGELLRIKCLVILLSCMLWCK
ncbi:MAG: hypothetical protein ACK56I_35880, partial [bacterium]